jgi:hypothetical protein
MAEMTYDAAEEAMRRSAATIRALEDEYETAMNDYADAEALYRKSIADAFRKYRGEGQAVEASMTMAKGDCWNLSRERDRAMAKSRVVMEKLEDRRGERVSTHRLVEWSTAHALTTAGIHADNGTDH